MKHYLLCACAVSALATTVYAQTPAGDRMFAPIVFFDIAGPDLATQKAFYDAVLGVKTDAMGQFQTPTIGPTKPALLRTDAKETMVYFGVDDINATMQKVVANGGRIHAPRYAVPGVVVMGLFIDPAGNRVGLVEMKDGKPIVP
jgi:predicted enzyme related to lactoylglutathione lyase